jgi:hypothetical protein
VSDLAQVLGGSSGPLPVDERVVWVPVRHHSPACARHLAVLLAALRPEHVLIEGPRDATPLIPLLQQADAVPPVALFTTFIDRSAERAEHHAAYYPLTSWSPEWVALRVAQQIGAEVAFIDLSLAERSVGRAPSAQPGSLQAEPAFSHGALIAALAARAGARDPDDLWDHLFESGAPPGDLRDSARFFGGVLGYCALVRATRSDAELVKDGTLAREACMAAEVAARSGRVVVVTGGLHTVALPGTEPRSSALPGRPEDRGVTLMRYHDAALDQLQGYAAGLPSPGFYRRLWEGLDPVELLVELARELRGDSGQPSLDEVRGAVVALRGLAALRGHHQPTREDLLDAVRSSFVKGALHVEGARVMAAARRSLVGDRRGEVPAEAGRPPLVQDAEARMRALRLELDGREDRTRTLDLYRKAVHRRTSRLLRCLAVLEVPFARCLRGPDYVARLQTERVQEVWAWRWTPGTERGLIEASRWGAEVEEATGTCLRLRLEAASTGDHRSARAAGVVVEAARCGLHSQLPVFLVEAGALLAEDPDVYSVGGAMEPLWVAAGASEPLELHALPQVQELARLAWERVTALLADLGRCTDEGAGAAVELLRAWHHTALRLEAGAPVVLEECLEALVLPATHPVVAGAAVGLLHARGAWTARRVGELLAARLVVPLDGARFLTGLLGTARPLAWQEDGVVGAVHEALATVDERTFLEVLPHLRLAFAALSPAELAQVAGRVVGHLGGGPLALDLRGWSAAEVIEAGRIEAAVRRRLHEDALGGWLDG